jgi:RNA polymerase sigma-70 factor (ECF subfamily)
LGDDLLTGLAAGDAAAYQQAYDLYGSALFRTAARMLGSRHDAEDAVQEVFAAMVRSRSSLSHVADLKAYLFAAVRHATARIHKRQRQQAVPGLEDAVRPADAPAEGSERAERLWELACGLPMEQREVLAMKIQGELTFSAIGAACGISPNTAASRYRYALEKLKQMMEQQQ